MKSYTHTFLKENNPLIQYYDGLCCTIIQNHFEYKFIDVQNLNIDEATIRFDGIFLPNIGDYIKVITTNDKYFTIFTGISPNNSFADDKLRHLPVTFVYNQTTGELSDTTVALIDVIGIQQMTNSEIEFLKSIVDNQGKLINYKNFRLYDKPFTPAVGQIYFNIQMNQDCDYEISKYHWANDSFDRHQLQIGNVFETFEEAQQVTLKLEEVLLTSRNNLTM